MLNLIPYTAICATLLYFYRQFAVHASLLDAPGARSSHEGITPRGGGLVFVALFAFALLALEPQPWHGVLYPAFGIAAVGFWDDVCDLSPRLRLVMQILCMSISLMMLHSLAPLVLWALPTFLVGALGLLALLWAINLFNFMDGTDGIATVEAITVLLGMGSFAFLHNQTALLSMTQVGTAILIGFLFWNWPKAKIFMGDVGSSFLGAFLALLIIIGHWVYQIHFIYGLMLSSLFIFDATVTLVRRILAGHNITQAHRLHAYQRCHQAGYSHQQILLGSIGLNLVILISTVISFVCPHVLVATACLDLLLLTATYGWIEKQKPFAS